MVLYIDPIKEVTAMSEIVIETKQLGAYKGLVSGEMRLAKFLSQCLRPVYGQAVVGYVTGVKTDDIVVALYVLPLLVLAVFQIGAHTGDCKIFLTAIKGRYAVIVTENKPPVSVQCGLHGKLVMLKG